MNNKKRIVIAFSVITMVLAIFAWPDLFIFSKVFYVPAWAKKLPDPLIATWGIVLLSALPLVIVKNNIKQLFLVMHIATFIAVASWCVTHHVGSMSNISYQFIFVFSISVLPPVLLMSLVKVVFSRFMQTQSTIDRDRTLS